MNHKYIFMAAGSAAVILLIKSNGFCQRRQIHPVNEANQVNQVNQASPVSPANPVNPVPPPVYPMYPVTPMEKGITKGTEKHTLMKVRSYMDVKFSRVDRQMSEYTCGLATLATLFTYYFDLPVHEDEIANDFLKNIIIEKRGISFLDMKNFIQSKGYKAAGYQVNLSALLMVLEETPVPIIIHTMRTQGKYDMGHFSLLLGYRDGYFIIKDPAFGNRVVSEESFSSEFTGRILIALPADKDKAILDKTSKRLKFEIINAQKYLLKVNYFEKAYPKLNYHFFTF
ncbi:MAG: cysteine peptidase family C39 domain-containing protein [bacterium]